MHRTSDRRSPISAHLLKSDNVGVIQRHHSAALPVDHFHGGGRVLNDI